MASDGKEGSDDDVIARLEAALEVAKARRALNEAAAAEERKRKSNVLAPKSPSPRKRPRIEEARPKPVRRDIVKPAASAEAVKQLEAPSRFNEGLERSRDQLEVSARRRDQPKSKGFERVPRESPPRVRDNEDLTVLEHLRLGARDFKPLESDLTWQKLEPNSKTRLRSRILPHDELQEYLEDRYLLSPSELYSIVRPSRGGTDYEVPLEEDWIVIGTLAEKSEIRTTNPSRIKVEAAEDDAEDALHEKAHDEEDEAKNKWKKKPLPRKAKKFLSYKLVDMGRKGAATNGDSVLSLLLFEADTAVYTDTGETVQDEELTAKGVRVQTEDRREKREKRYMGGSYGAYERFWKEGDGAVVAVINPKVMRPRPAAPGMAANNIISITPENAESIIVIGRSEDLGHCQALRRDGKPCKAWCDLRVHDVCDFHIQERMRRSRSGRSELMTGTGGMQSTVTKGRRGGKTGAEPDFDNKTGLLPAQRAQVVEGSKAWVLSGPSKPTARVAGPAGHRMPAGASYTHPTVGTFFGNENAAAASTKKSKQQKAEEEAALLRRLKRDGGKTIGGQYLRAAATEEDEEAESNIDQLNKRAFSSRDVRKIGFNPSVKREDAPRPLDQVDQQRQKLEAPTNIKRTLGKRARPADASEDDFEVMAPETGSLK